MLQLTKRFQKNKIFFLFGLGCFIAAGYIINPYFYQDDWPQWNQTPYKIKYTASGQIMVDRVGLVNIEKYEIQQNKELICLPYLHRCHGYEYLTQFKNNTLESKVKNCPIQITTVLEEYPEKAYLNLESDCFFSVNESKEIASNYMKIMSPSYQAIRVYISQNIPVDKYDTRRENHFIIEYSGEDLKTEHIIKKYNPLTPVFRWFNSQLSSLWPHEVAEQ